ncbi:hypothetical protein [Loigolactobacillus bifermentans]|uniref:Uncharacterized protein n=1 Tax=Loigolactobacillus bifermentans DSM 20003 TaxID=1423726 RepID=A0A0R1GKF9_9LACO|nr:hypothetical protein [Loigolactobacillus bifermentans]KRK34541.1 hypothetical protein FC07_GL000555 [Loigolactobacillus bifermentans DSM 20003]QGG61317.1 hypothetical protein LB003_13040 [Loigolactobacillus bifermentans]
MNWIKRFITGENNKTQISTSPLEEHKITAEEIDPVRTPLPDADAIQDRVFYGIDISITSIVRILRANNVDDMADILKNMIPIFSWLFFDKQINNIGGKFLNADSDEASPCPAYWHYEWITLNRWPFRSQVRSEFYKAAQDINIYACPDSEFEKVLNTRSHYERIVDELNSLDPDVYRTSNDYRNSDIKLFEFLMIGHQYPHLNYLNERILLRNTLLKVTDFEEAFFTRYHPKQYRDVLSLADYSNIIHVQALKNLDFNIIAGVINKFKDPVMRNDLLEIDSFSTLLLTDLNDTLTSIMKTFDFVDEYAKKLRAAKAEHKKDMERAKIIEHLNEHIKPLDNYRDGFKIENIEYPKDLNNN